jgi:transposase
MTYGAIDLHKKESQVQVITETGEVIDCRVRTERDAFAQVFGHRAPMRVLLEASTESEWVAGHLESLGHTVIVADPNYAAMYGTRTRRIKTDRRDVSALLEANRRGTYRPVHRRSAQARALQRELRVRGQLVRTRTRAISLVRALTRGAGCRIASGAPETFLPRLAQVPLPPALEETLRPVCSVIRQCTEELQALDAHFTARAKRDPVMQRLMTVPAIGAITATAVVGALDNVARFSRAAQVASYFGLVPRAYSSGERQRRGHLLRSAHPEVQALLVQAAWSVWRSRTASTAELRSWTDGIARRRGRNIAVVALARRLARIVFAIWRDETVFGQGRGRPQDHAVTALRTDA